jgi:hypothetical protein
MLNATTMNHANHAIESVFPSVQAPLLMLDGWDYAQQLFLPNAAIPWHDPVAFEAVYRQMLGLLRPQVATLDLTRLVLAHAEHQHGLRDAMTRRPRLSFPLKALLADPTLAQRLKQLIATTRDARGNRPLALTLSTPLNLLRQAYELAHGQTMPPEGEDDAERAAVYLADFLTRAAHDGVAALMLIDRDAQGAQAGFADALSPLVNLARHMRWKLLMASQAQVNGIEGIDLLWTPGTGNARWPADFLSADRAPDIAALFAEIPSQAQPEQVLERITMWSH